MDVLRDTADRTRFSPSLLGIYLNDHLAGATGAVGLAGRSAAAHKGHPTGTALEHLAAEIGEDREALLDMFGALGVPVRRYKVYGAWLAEKAGRLKFNGRIRHRSPLSALIEIETLWMGVHGKAAAWETLRALADHDSRLDAARLDELISRARRQTSLLEELRENAAAEAFIAAG